MDHKVEIVAQTCGFKGFFRLDKVRLRHRLFSGEMSQTLYRELLVRDQAVAVLLYDPDNDQVVLVEQFRIGALDRPNGPWLLETVAGIVEPNESLEEVAHREAEEESGCAIINDLIHICDYLPSPGGASEVISLYCGRVNSNGVGGIYGVTEEGEDIKVHVLSTQAAFDAVQDGTIDSASPIIALQWLQLHLSQVRDQWLAN